MKKSCCFSRRRFLRNACFAGAGLAAAGLAGSLNPLLAMASPAAKHLEQQTRLLMGTMVTLSAATRSSGLAEEGFAAAFAEMERLIAIFDRHNMGSALSTLNAHGRLPFAPPELVTVLQSADSLGLATEHAFNPAITPVVDLFASTRSSGSGLQPANISAGELADVLALAQPGALRVSGNDLQLERRGMQLTLDGIAKGFIADRASRILSNYGLNDHMVNAGGDIRCRGNSAPGRPWNVGVQHPVQAGKLLASASFGNGGIATSGSYENYYDRARSRHHLVSHLTGKSAEAASVTVRADSAMQADALATALALMPPGEALRFAKRQNTPCLILDRYGRRYQCGIWG